MHEYAFDVKMSALVRIKANDQEQAERALTRALDCASLKLPGQDAAGEAIITECSIDVDDADYPFLFEIDGKDAESD